MSTFGERLRIAFGNARNADIARKMGVTESAVKNYITGRVPDHTKLLEIKALTNCDLDWLLTGDEKAAEPVTAPPPLDFEGAFEAKVREIVRDELQRLDDVGGEVAGIEAAERITVRHLGTVSGGEEEEHDAIPRRRRAG